MARSTSVLVPLLFVVGLNAIASHAEEPARRGVPAAATERIAAELGRWLPELLEDYRHLHAHPELSLQETETARFLAERLRGFGFEVIEGVGGTGVLGLMRNGDGPVVLVRGDMDALPVIEETGLAYASRVRVRDETGREVGVMHACGHDVHTSSLIGVGRALAALRADWRGTLVLLGQPAEELGRGALAMIEDGLFERIPRPDHAISLHVDHTLPAGSVGVRGGFAAANVDAVRITVHGRGGHGARPESAVDPIVAAAEIVTALQTIVSRRVVPGTPAVVTVGSIHGGTKSNVIPDEVELALTVRSYADDVRASLLEGIREIAEGVCAAHRCVKPPTVAVRENHTPSLYNDPGLSAHARSLFEAILGPERVLSPPPTMGGEDFARYARRGGFPGLQYRLGSIAPERIAASRQPGGEPLPSVHSSRYAPDAAPTLETGVYSLAHLALSLLGVP